ncbi:hypothetical protein C0993_004765, partial [Termitomyces sp. T159_Od127]
MAWARRQSRPTEELGELAGEEEAPQEVEEQSVVDDAESVQIDGDEYVAVDVYDNDYYTRDDKKNHMFALTEHQEDRRICMQHVTMQKAADKLQRPQYTPQEKECLEVDNDPTLAQLLEASSSFLKLVEPQIQAFQEFIQHSYAQDELFAEILINPAEHCRFTVEHKLIYMNSMTGTKV